MLKIRYFLYFFFETQVISCIFAPVITNLSRKRQPAKPPPSHMFDFASYSQDVNLTIVAVAVIALVQGILAGKVFEKIKDK